MLKSFSKGGFTGNVEDDWWFEVAVELVVGGGGIEGVYVVGAIELVKRTRLPEGVVEVDELVDRNVVREDLVAVQGRDVDTDSTLRARSSKRSSMRFKFSSNVKIRFSRSSVSDDEVELEVIDRHDEVEEAEGKVGELRRGGRAPMA